MPLILYIEDDFNNRMLVRRILMVEGYEVEEAENAIDGIRRAQEIQPDLILMDISMPDMDGLTATSKIRGIPAISKIPVVALTANVMDSDREKTLEAGCDGFIGKPIDVDTFADEVSSFLK